MSDQPQDPQPIREIEHVRLERLELSPTPGHPGGTPPVVQRSDSASWAFAHGGGAYRADDVAPMTVNDAPPGMTLWFFEAGPHRFTFPGDTIGEAAGNLDRHLIRSGIELPAKITVERLERTAGS